MEKVGILKTLVFLFFYILQVNRSTDTAGKKKKQEGLQWQVKTDGVVLVMVVYVPDYQINTLNATQPCGLLFHQWQENQKHDYQSSADPITPHNQAHCLLAIWLFKLLGAKKALHDSESQSGKAGAQWWHNIRQVSVRKNACKGV